MRTVALLFLAFTAGCGAKFENVADDGGGAHDGGSVDGATYDGGTWSPVCPAAEPTVGGACATGGVECEYGDSVYTACNRLYACGRELTWNKVNYGGTCPSGMNPSVCAPSFASVTRGAECSAVGAACAYPEGACRCEYPGFGPPPPSDGGLKATWRCDDPPPGCPAHRPRVGSACSAPMSCMYVECAFEESCSMGYWHADPVGCANGGGSP